MPLTKLDKNVTSQIMRKNNNGVSERCSIEYTANRRFFSVWFLVFTKSLKPTNNLTCESWRQPLTCLKQLQDGILQLMG